MDHVDRILAQWRRERPDLDVAPMGTIGRLGRIARRLSAEMEKTFAAFGLNGASFDVLATLRRSGPPYALCPGDLMATAMVTSGTMTNRIDQLEKAGLVERRNNPEDARSVIIALTPKGFGLIEEAVAAHVATQARLMSPLSKDERAELDRLLSTFLSRMEDDRAGDA
ncbi:MarR family winged helix-turn-helix transcriptional regulator [Microvirga thermotolerans]|uniref:MarR family transcriptional regulator n=1 Tax=Microvirga thermotolerans TaxID=2651334 RepID=A0A5P9JWH4_9HYPH|nr:MarR family transcriptional regulator [Microvirga thermotolerans]QFU15996.1 MarR family transcriptional regulator [Microvirga thermotolerans]